MKKAEDRIRQRNRELRVLPEIGRELSARLDVDEIGTLVLKRSVEALGALTGHIVILNFKSPFHKEYHISKADLSPFKNPIPLFNSLIEEMRENPDSIVIDDAENDEHWQHSPTHADGSVMIVPISGRYDLVGILILTHENKNYFSTEHLVLTQAIASQAGIALENSRLYTDLSKEQERISVVLNSAADGILMFDVDGCLSIINPTAAALFASTNVKPGLPLARGQGFDDLIEALEVAFDAGRPHRVEITWPDQRIFTADFYVIYSTFFVRYLVKEAGFSMGAAGGLWLKVGLVSVISGFIWGSLSDRWGRRLALLGVFGLQGLAFLLFGLSRELPVIYVSAGLFAVTAWSIPALMAALAGDIFGGRLAPAPSRGGRRPRVGHPRADRRRWASAHP